MNIGVIEGLFGISGNSFGLLGGYLYKFYGFHVPFYTTTCLYMVSFCYVLFVIRDRIPRENGESRGLLELFSIGHIRDNIRMLRRKRVGHTRRHIYVVLFSLLLFSVCDSGMAAIYASYSNDLQI